MAGFQGVVAGHQGHHHARPRRLGHHRGGARRRAATPTSARSTPTWTACSPPTRGSCPNARHIAQITYEEMLELAACGAKVLHLRCVEYARRYGVADPRPVVVLDQAPAPWSPDRWRTFPWSRPSSPASRTTAARRRSPIVGVPDEPGEAARIFDTVAERRDQHRHDRAERLDRGHRPHRHLVHPAQDRRPDRDGRAAARCRSQVGFEGLLYDDHIGKVSLIGAGMRSHPGVAARFFAALADAGVNIEMISTSEIRISVVCRDTDLDRRGAGRRTTRSSSAATTEAVVYARDRPVSADGAAAHPGRGRRDRRRRHGDAATCCPPGANVWGEIRLIASPRSAGRQAARAAARSSTCGALTAGGVRRRRRGHVRRARRGLGASGRRSRPPAARWWWTTPARSGWTRTCRWWCPRSTRSRSRNRPQGHHRQPELHHAVDDRRGRRRCTASTACEELVRRLLPGGLRRRAGRHRHAATTSSPRSPGTGRSARAPATCARRSATTSGPFPAPLALNVVPWAGSLHGRRLVVRGAEDPQRVAQDPRPARPEGLRDLRPGAGGHRPLGGRARRLRRPRSDAERRPGGAARRARA